MINKTVGDRYELAKMFVERKFTRGAEIGVRAGGFSEILLQNENIVKLYSVDPWDIVYQDPRSRSEGKIKQESYFQQAQERLSKYPASEIIRKTSLEAVREIPHESLDFVYIDGAHTFDYVMTDIIEWSKRVRKGGIVSGDDYKPHKYGDVITPVNLYATAHKIKTLNIMYPKDIVRDITPQWWFIKQ